MGDIAVLLGAGASSDADLPKVGEMTETLAQIFQNTGDLDTQRVRNFVAGQLLGQKERRGQNPFIGADVERVMTTSELLGERRNLELAPFVHTWDPASLIRKLKVIARLGAHETSSRDKRGPWFYARLPRPRTDAYRFRLSSIGVGTGDPRVFCTAFERLTAALVYVLGGLVTRLTYSRCSRC